MENIELNKNVNLHILNTTKFKDVSIYVDFLDNSDKKDQCTRYMLALMLEDTCSVYDTKQLVTNKLNSLYDARISFFPDVKGNARIFELRTSFINGKFVGDSNLLEEQFKIINNFLLNPIFKYKKYPSDLFNEIKDRIRLLINNENDNPHAYANKMADILFGNFLKVKSDYSIEDLNSVTLEDVINLYNKIIHESAVDIFVVGDIDNFKVEELTKKYLIFNDREAIKNLVYTSSYGEYLEKQEERKINQTQVELRYTTNKTSYSDNFHAMVIANGILGTLPTSLLFQEIREKRSLCYTIASSVNGYDGTLKIFTGINKDNIQVVKDLIELQINKIKQGEFSDELLETTKKMYINAYRQSNDNIKSIMWDEYRNTLINDNLTLEKSIELINKVKREDIVDIFSDVTLKVCFILKQKEVDHE